MLQKKLFALHPGLINLGLYPLGNIGNDKVRHLEQEDNDKIPYLRDSRISLLYKILSQLGGLEFDHEMAKRLWQQISTDYGSSHSNGETSAKFVLSHEAITSCRFAHPEVREKARRLRDVFGHIKIILICRRQQEMLKSLYRDHPFDPRSLENGPKPVCFAEWLELDLERGPLSLSRSLYFGRAASVFDDLFGRDNVLVLPMELLDCDLVVFSEQISRFLEVDSDLTYRLLASSPVNAAVSALGMQYRSVRANLLPWARYLSPFKNYLLSLDAFAFDFVKGKGRPAVIEIDNRQDQMLRKLFADDNARLAKSRSLSLKNLGYYV